MYILRKQKNPSNKRLRNRFLIILSRILSIKYVFECRLGANCFPWSQQSRKLIHIKKFSIIILYRRQNQINYYFFKLSVCLPSNIIKFVYHITLFSYFLFWFWNFSISYHNNLKEFISKIYLDLFLQSL